MGGWVVGWVKDRNNREFFPEDNFSYTKSDSLRLCLEEGELGPKNNCLFALHKQHHSTQKQKQHTKQNKQKNKNKQKKKQQQTKKNTKSQATLF